MRGRVLTVYRVVWCLSRRGTDAHHDGDDGLPWLRPITVRRLNDGLPAAAAHTHYLRSYGERGRMSPGEGHEH